MMCLELFETQDVRDRPEGSRIVETFSHLMDENNRCLPDGRKKD